MLSYPDDLAIDDDIGLRLSTPDDIDGLAAIFADPRLYEKWDGPIDRAVIEEKYVGKRLPGVAVYVVLWRSQTIGLIQAWQDLDTRGLDMGLAGDFQNRGLGPKIARALAVELSDRGWHHISVDPSVTNARAIRAWEKAGFVKTSRFGEYGGEQTVLLEFGENVPGGMS